MAVVYKIKRFARADYAGLSESQKVALKMERDEIAKNLLKKRKANNRELLEAGKEILMNPQSREHGKFVNGGLLRDNRVTKDAMGQIETRNYFGRKKIHEDRDITRYMNRNQDGFIWERGTRRDSHASDISNARSQAKAARERILANKPQQSTTPPPVSPTKPAPPVLPTIVDPIRSTSNVVGSKTPLKNSVNNRRMARIGKYAGAVALGTGLGMGAYHMLKKDNE